ncbi:MAG: DNA polymerase III subunit gamma/tau [Flavobacteriales bacterium]|nr:DNA polymerase III subunit gamma/tau [Flavobacteriales bacterium]
MEQFLVSARKYRPVSFETMIGQEHITETLLNEIKQNRLAQSFLFTGPRGVGKTTCARILARVINLESDAKIPKDYDFAFNIFELDAASNNSVDDIRQLVEQVRIPPQIGKYKVYIIDEVHMLSTNAFNAFLKTLEEPPSYAIFILATTEKHKILPTILSRCQIFNFKRIEPAAIVKQLQEICQNEEIKADDKALHVIASKADGGMRDALSMFDQLVSFSNNKTINYEQVIENLNVLDNRYFFEITDALNSADYGKALVLFDDILGNGFDGQFFLNGLASHFRDLLVVRQTSTAFLIGGSGQAVPEYKTQSMSLSAGFLMNAIQVADQFDQSYKSSHNQRLHVELALIKMANINAAINLAEELKKKTPELSEKSISELKDEEKRNLPQNKAVELSVEKKPLTGKVLRDQSVSKLVNTVKLGNIKDLVHHHDPKKAVDLHTENKEVDVVEEIEESPVVRQELRSAIESFAKIQKDEGLHFAYTMISELKIEEVGEILIVTLTNSRDKNQFDEIKGRFLQFINKQTHSAFSLEIKIEKPEHEVVTVYTNKEKFSYLAKKNPYLIDFGKEFGLEIE